MSNPHIIPHHHAVNAAHRSQLMGHPARVYWFTGLSGSGKSTLASLFEFALHGRGIHTYLLDGDNVRMGLNAGLGFSEADRRENLRRIAEVAKLMNDAGLVVLAAFVSPFEADRSLVKHIIGPEHFIEVFVDAPLDVCEQRDVKGLYAKARRGEIAHFTGIHQDFEVPPSPDLTIPTHLQTPEVSVQRLLQHWNDHN
jgi:adenylyl-sulfate kinase